MPSSLLRPAGTSSSRCRRSNTTTNAKAIRMAQVVSKIRRRSLYSDSVSPATFRLASAVAFSSRSARAGVNIEVFRLRSKSSQAGASRKCRSATLKTRYRLAIPARKLCRTGGVKPDGRITGTDEAKLNRQVQRFRREDSIIRPFYRAAGSGRKSDFSSGLASGLQAARPGSAQRLKCLSPVWVGRHWRLP